MTTTMRTWILALGLAGGLASGSAATAAELKDGPVKRGTRVEDLRTQMGDPQKVVASEGDGVRVEKWMYPGDVIVVVQDGYVLDSFVEKK